MSVALTKPMPPWVAFVPQSMGTLAKISIGRLAFCSKHRNVAVPRPWSICVRYASARVSPTSINVRPSIPQPVEGVYSALSELSRSAETYVNISRLQLALSGLAAQDGVTRVAFLSMGSQMSAQKLARLLLADALGAVEQWEEDLETPKIEDERPVLLRYGDESDPHPPTPLYRVLSVPSRLLRAHNLELLISTLDADLSNVSVAATSETPKDMILVPKLLATSARGLPVPYPVHKTLVLGKGLDDAVAYGRFTSKSAGKLGDMVKVAIDLPPPLEEAQSTGLGACSSVSLDVGTEALARFRESIENSAIYERGWFRSGMPGLSHWLVQGLEPSEPIKPAMKALISSILDDVEANIGREESAQLSRTGVPLLHQQTRESILGHLESWAEQSHRELRDQLDEAFSARSWRKLSWWKLFWRVDDVSMITSEILERRWLVEAEKGALYLAGRMNQAGFPEVIEHSPEHLVLENAQRTSTQNQTSSLAARQPEPPPSPPPSMDVSTEVRQNHTWHTQISICRTILKGTIPPLQALAQRLVLTTISTTSLSSALSVLLYLSMSSISLFEAGSVAALGLVYSLRRMQKLWEAARSTWQLDVKEDGRRALKFTEEMARLIVRDSAKTIPDEEGTIDRKRAREAAERVREALSKM